MKNPESKKAPCLNCRQPLRITLASGGTAWMGCCGTWTLDSAGKFARPARRFN